MRFRLILPVVALLATACTLPVTPAPEPAAPAGQAIDTARPTPTLASSATPLTRPTETLPPSRTPTAALQPTATPLSTATALPPDEVAPPAADPTRAALAGWLAAAWADGRPFEAVRDQLAAEGRLAPDDLGEQLDARLGALPAVAVDLDGDGREEWLFSLVLSESETSCGYPLLGQLWVVNDDGVIVALEVDETGAYWQVPLVVDQTDLTGDGLPELITKSIGCGAHTQYSLFHVLSGHGGQIGGIVAPGMEGDPLWEQRAALERFGVVYSGRTPGIALSFGEHGILYRDALGPPLLLVTGGIFGSVGAGNHRARTETWLWDGRRLRLTAIDMAPSEERVHRLYDANLALAVDNLDMAVQRYLEVVRDEGLQDTVAYLDDDGGYALARQWAAFRLQLAALLLEDEAAAAEWAAWPAANYPGAPLSQAATILADAAAQGDLAAACRQVTDFLATQSDPLGGLADTGYGNPALAVEDLCPIE